MTAEFDPKTFIGTVVHIAPKTNPIKLTGQIDAPAANLIGQLAAVCIRIEMRRQAFLHDLRGVNAQLKRTIPSTLHDAFIAWNTTGIFSWIAAHAAVEAAAEGAKDTTPYWRTLKSKGELNPKYPGGIAGLKRKLSGEGHNVIQKGKRFFVEDFETRLASL